MWMDKYLEFSVDQDLDAEVSTILSTSQVDLSVVRDIGAGVPLYLVMVVTEAFTDGGDAATLEVRLVSDDTATIHASTSTLHFSSGAMLKAKLPIKAKFIWPLPWEGNAYEQFIGVNYVIATAGFDAGWVTTFITSDPSAWKAYPDASN